MHRIFVFMLLCCFFSACNKKTQQLGETLAEKPAIETPEVVEETTPVVVEEVEPVLLLCEFKRSACYGKCPVFNVKLYSDATAIYEGIANVDLIGKYTTRIEAIQFEEIFTAAELANYFVLRSQYPADGNQLSDLPKTTSYLKRGGLEKRIINNYSAPSELVRFENWMESFFLGLEWELKN